MTRISMVMMTPNVIPGFIAGDYLCPLKFLSKSVIIAYQKLLFSIIRLEEEVIICLF